MDSPPTTPRSIFDRSSQPPPRALPARLMLRPKAPVAAEAVTTPSRSPPEALEARVLEILGSLPTAGESAAGLFQRKEAELGALFATLTVLESRALHARLSNPRPGDVLTDKFDRLTVERRNRLVNFLAGARRRAAVATHR